MPMIIFDTLLPRFFRCLPPFIILFHFSHRAIFAAAHVLFDYATELFAAHTFTLFFL